MSKSFDEDLDVPEGIYLGNWIWGNVVVTPQPNQTTSVDVTGLNIAGEGEMYPQASVKSAYPYVSSGMVGVDTVPVEGEDPLLLWETDDYTQFRISYMRSTDAETRIHWMVWRDRNAAS